MAQRPAPAVIAAYARQLGLDPRAVLSVAAGEGGFYNRPNDIGDLAGGGSYGPFQLYAKGALPRRFVGNPKAADAWAWSPAGIKYAVSQMAPYARGLKGAAAIDAIVRKFEKPANPGKSIANAVAYYNSDRKLPEGGVPVFSRQTGFTNRFNSNSGPKQKVLQQWAMSSLDSYINDQESPGPLALMQALQEAEGPIPTKVAATAAPSAAGTQTPYGGAKGAKAMIALIREAQRRGLRVSENPFVDKVDPVHTRGSQHYQMFPGSRAGKAVDIGGNPKQLQQMFRWVEANRGRLGLNDMFYDPVGYSYDRGKRWGKTIGGHGSHVHASIF